jgi:hypothetical protein
MRLIDKLKAALGAITPGPPETRRLNPMSESTLSASLKGLPRGERGWITLREAWRLFSRMDEELAFGELDDEGKSRLGQFAAEASHRSDFAYMPVERRLYFTRK